VIATALAAVALIAAGPSWVGFGVRLVPSDAPGGRDWAARSGLDCSGVFVHRDQPAVLLIPGTGQTVESSWGSGYLSALPAAGFDACAVPLVDLGHADIRLSAEHVSWAIDSLGRDHPSGRVDIVTFSQGGLEARWSLRSRPALRATVPAVVELGAPNEGTPVSLAFCQAGCSPAVSQMHPGSSFLRDLNGSDPAPSPTVWTNVFSADDVIVPLVYAALPGTHEVLVQSVCPGRRVGHADFLTDGAVYRIVLARLRGAALGSGSVCAGARVR
jgi:triacylglycerol lipase